MAELFDEAAELQQLCPGDVRRGTIVAMSADGVVVEIEPGQAGLVPQEDLDRLSPDERRTLQEGQEVLVYVTDVEDTSGPVQLSLYLAQKEQDWLQAEELMRRDGFWEGEVRGYNKGGLVVPFGHIRGFVPASQISGIPRRLAPEEKVARLAEMVGQRLPLKVIDIDRRQRRLVFSERLGRIAQRDRQLQEVYSQLRKGQICRGRIRSLTDYGAFVDLGGVVGLLHRTELAYFRVEHPCEVVEEGQEVEVCVLRVSRKRGRVSLSLKRTYSDPWPAAMERYQLRQLVEGRVIRRTGAGLFVLLDDGVLGLVPVADLRQSDRMQEEVAFGRRVLARVVRIDGARRRLGLSLRRVRPDEWANWQERQEQSPVKEESLPEGDGDAHEE